MPVLLRLALSGGRADTLRIALTALVTALTSVALLSAGAVLAIGTAGCPVAGGRCGYSNPLLDQAGLRPGTAATLVLLCVPVIFLAGQCARVGSPARDRRLAAVRMAGATPRQATAVVALEVGLAALAGVVLGSSVFLVGRLVLDDPDAAGQRRLPTDVLPSPIVWVVVLVGVPLFATLLSVLALRRVRLTPFGVVRRSHSHPPRLLPLALLAIGTAGLLLAAPLTRQLYQAAVWVVAISALSLVLTGLGLTFGAAALSSWVGGLVARRLPGPAWLVAGRRLVADPWQSSRSLSAMLLAVLVGGGVIGVRQAILGDLRLQQLLNERAAVAAGEPAGLQPIDPFYANTFTLLELALLVAVVIAALALLVAAAEQVVQGRRALAALTAAGTPRRVLRRALLLQSAIPLVPGVLLATLLGWVGSHGLFGWTLTEQQGGYSTCTAPESMQSAAAAQSYCSVPAHQVRVPEMTMHLTLGVPWAQLGLLLAVGIVGTLLITALSLTLLRRSTDVSELRASA